MSLLTTPLLSVLLHLVLAKGSLNASLRGDHFISAEHADCSQSLSVEKHYSGEQQTGQMYLSKSCSGQSRTRAQHVQVNNLWHTCRADHSDGLAIAEARDIFRMDYYRSIDLSFPGDSTSIDVHDRLS